MSPCLWLLSIAEAANPGRSCLWPACPSFCDSCATRRLELDSTNTLQAAWKNAALYAAGADQVPWLAALLLVVAPLGLLFLANNRTMGSGDTIMVMPTASSLVPLGDWNLDEFFSSQEKQLLPYFVRQTPQGVYSNYPAGMVTFAVPIAGAGAIGRSGPGQSRHGRTSGEVDGGVAGRRLCRAFLCRGAARDHGRAGHGLTMILSVASSFYGTVSQALWQHGGTIFWSLMALAIEFHAARRPCSRAQVVLQGFACGMMFACRLTAAAFLLPLGLWIMMRSPRRALAVAACAGAATPWAWLYFSIYGTILGPSARMMDGSPWSTRFVGGLAGILISPGRGLFIYQPWMLAALAFRPGDRDTNWPAARLEVVLLERHSDTRRTHLLVEHVVGRLLLGLAVADRYFAFAGPAMSGALDGALA